jgi:hypothetical protein
MSDVDPSGLTPVAQAVLDEAVRMEGPVEIGRLAGLVAARCGIRRLAANRHEAIERAVPSDWIESTPWGKWIWPPEVDRLRYPVWRVPTDEPERTLDEVAPAEIRNALAAAVAFNPRFTEDELARTVASLFGVRRFTTGIAERIVGILEATRADWAVAALDEFDVGPDPADTSLEAGMGAPSESPAASSSNSLLDQLEPRMRVRLLAATRPSGSARLLFDTDAGDPDEACIALAACEKLCLVRELVVRCSITDRGAEALASSPHVRGLRALRLEGTAAGDSGVRALSSSQGFDGLEHVHIEGAGIGDAGLKALAESRTLLNLKRLGLGGQDENHRLKLNVEALGALWESGLFAGVRDLTLRHVVFESKSLDALAGSPRMMGLTGLHLDDVRLGKGNEFVHGEERERDGQPVGYGTSAYHLARAIAESPFLRRLKALSLRRLDLVTLETTEFPLLRRLDLSGNPLRLSDISDKAKGLGLLELVARDTAFRMSIEAQMQMKDGTLLGALEVDSGTEDASLPVNLKYFGDIVGSKWEFDAVDPKGEGEPESEAYPSPWDDPERAFRFPTPALAQPQLWNQVRPRLSWVDAEFSAELFEFCHLIPRFPQLRQVLMEAGEWPEGCGTPWWFIPHLYAGVSLEDSKPTMLIVDHNGLWWRLPDGGWDVISFEAFRWREAIQSHRDFMTMNVAFGDGHDETLVMMINFFEIRLWPRAGSHLRMLQTLIHIWWPAVERFRGERAYRHGAIGEHYSDFASMSEVYERWCAFENDKWWP